MQPSDDQRVRATQLTSDALEASILGDLEGARQLLQQAAESDPTSPEVAYRHGRALEDVEMREAAITEYCRALALGAVDVGIADARDRIDALYEIVRARITDRARNAFVAGLGQADAALYEEAVTSFTVALEEVPDWAEAVYNRAIVLEQLGRVQESLRDYRQYVTLSPTEIDPVVAAVVERIGMLEGTVAAPTPSPGATLAVGVVPGMGHYYSGRTMTGTVVLGLALGTVAAGYAYKEVTATCLYAPTAGGDCPPPNEVLYETTERPYLMPAIGVAAAITIAGAVEAYIRARGRRAERDEAIRNLTGGEEVRLTGPSVSARGSRVDVSFLQLRFR